MDSQPGFVRKLILWGLAWIVILSFLAGLVLWKAPIGAAEGSQVENSPSTPTVQSTPNPSQSVFFPLLFKDGQPSSTTP